MKEKLKAVGGFVIGVALMILICVIVAIFLRGSAWVSEKVLPILTEIGAITFFPLILIVLPLSIFRKCRGWCGAAFVYWSYLCGLCLWMTSLLVTINLWGYIAAIIGLFMAGIGVFPIAVIACMFKGEWSLFFQLILQFVLLIGCRLFGFYLAHKAEQEEIWDANEKRDSSKQFVKPWLRWILVLPAAIGAWIGIQIGIILVSGIIDIAWFGGLGGANDTHLVQFLNTVASAWAFVFAGARTAPSKRGATALCLTALFILGAFGVIYLAQDIESAKGFWGTEWSLICLGVSAVTMAIMCYEICKEEKHTAVVAVCDAFSAASNAYDAAYDAIQIYTTRANHRFEISNARHDETLDAEAYDETVAAYTDPADFATYTETELDAHTAAMENLTAAFDTLTAAFATFNHPDAGITSTAAELYKVYCETYKFAVDAYSNAASCALGTALEGNVQAAKDQFEIMLLEARANNPGATDPVVAKAKAANFRARTEENAAKAKTLEQKARVAETKAKEFLATATPGAKPIMSGIVADALALAKPDLVEEWLQQGKGFYFGYRVSKSYEKAFELFTKAAAAGHPEAQFHVGLCFEDGDGVKPDQFQAVEWYLKSAINGFAKSQNNLAICFRDGQGVPMDYDEAEKWYCMAAAQGYAPTSCRPKSEERGHGMTCEWLSSLKNPGAVPSMGFYYRYKFDHGAPQDGIEEINWHRTAAEQGRANAQTNLGVCYEFGHGVQQDFTEAAKWYRLAAEQDCADAQNKLVVGIQSGQIDPLDSDEEWKWYLREEKSRLVKSCRKGAERGEASEQLSLGLFYEKGMGVPQDLPEAYKWFKLADEKLADEKSSDFLGKKFTSLSSSMTSEQLLEGERRYQEFNSPHRSNNEKAAELPVSKPRGKLLVVDAEDGPRQSMRVIFKDEYDLFLAEDGPTAIKLAQENDIDVVVTGLRMAGMSGLEVLERLKYMNPEIEVIIMTGFETTDTVLKALRLRASDYINMPFDLATMRAAVNKAMQRHLLACEKSAARKKSSSNLEKVADLPLFKRRGRLLILDGEDGPRQALRLIFEGEYDVFLAEDGLTAIELAMQHDIDVAVLDTLAGRELSGIKALERLKILKPDIEVIMMTAFETNDLIRESLRLGACDYINKPFDLATMRAAVSKAMQHHTRASEMTACQQK